MLPLYIVRPFLAIIAALLCAALPRPALAARASIHYFDHEYRVTFGLSGAVEQLASSTASVKLERVVSTVTYTNGAKFVTWNPDGVTLKDLNDSPAYEFEERISIIEGGNSVLLPPRGFAAAVSRGGLEEIAATLGVEMVSAEILSGRTASGKRFRVLYVPSRPEERLWSPTCSTEHRLQLDGKRAALNSIAVPLGLGAPSEDTVEEASAKDSNLLLSLGGGGRLAAAAPDSGIQLVIDYLTSAGTDAAALEPRDLKALWLAQSSGTLKLPLTAPELIASNARISDPALSRIVRPYALRKLAGRTVAVIALSPADPETGAELANSPITLWNPRDEEALGAFLKELREKHNPDLVAAVSFYRREDFGWLTSARGIDLVIGPKSWDSPAPRLTRVELDGKTSQAVRTPALLVYPDASGAGKIEVDFSRFGSPVALKAEPERDSGRVFDQPARNRMKELIISQVLGSADSLLPDPRRIKLGKGQAYPFYAIPDFFNMSAGLLRKRLKAEVAVLRLNPNGSSVLGDTPSSMIKVWLGPDEPLELALVPGALIRSYFRKAVPAMTEQNYYSVRAFQGKEYYALSGLDEAGRVSGLPLSDGELYLAAMPASLLAGKPGVQRLPPLQDTLHGLVTAELRKLKKAAKDRAAWENSVAVAVANRTELRRLWRINLRRLSLQASNSGVNSPAGYSRVGESKLSAVDQTRIQGSGRLYSEYYSDKFRFDTGISADYGKVVLRPEGQPRLTTESVDQLEFESDLTYRLREYNGALGPIVLGPFAAAAYDTEFSRAEPLPLRRILRGTVGLKLFEGSNLQEFYTAFTTEEVYTYSPYRTKFAAETGFRLSWPVPGTALTLLADGNYRNFARSRYDTVYDLKDRLELNARLSTRLYRDITINPYISFLQANGKKLSGTGSNLTAGFSLEYTHLFKLKR